MCSVCETTFLLQQDPDLQLFFCALGSHLWVDRRDYKTNPRVPQTRLGPQPRTPASSYQLVSLPLIRLWTLRFARFSRRGRQQRASFVQTRLRVRHKYYPLIRERLYHFDAPPAADLGAFLIWRMLQKHNPRFRGCRTLF